MIVGLAHGVRWTDILNGPDVEFSQCIKKTWVKNNLNVSVSSSARDALLEAGRRFISLVLHYFEPEEDIDELPPVQELVRIISMQVAMK
jgi:hypothetical protein